jgi:hypothetical protein
MVVSSVKTHAADASLATLITRSKFFFEFGGRRGTAMTPAARQPKKDIT